MSNIPTSIGRYEILGSIGRGGMGTLFLALDPKLDRQLAIKLLRDDDDDLRERFAREARAAARLRHPNIVTIFDVGEHDGQPFIAMEYIQGQTLAEVVRGSVPMSLVRKLELMESLCDGLGFAHKGGIIHRDIKPANLMLDADGSLKILDFGIARASESSSMTQAGMLIGTLNYMSPEQVSGLPVDLRSDLFAVGAVFYELVSYRQAFPGGLMAGILNKIVSAQPEPLPSIVPGIDADVVRIIERALDKDPARRYQDLPAMRQEIVLARARIAATEPMRVLTTPADDGETRVTPSPSSSSTRRATDLEGLARRRTGQVQTHVKEAEAKLALGDGEGAVAAAEQALLLDPNCLEAHGVVDRARAAMETRQVDAALDDAAGGIARGDFAMATQAVDRAAEIDPKSSRLADVRRSLDDAVRRQDEARQREALERRVREAVADADRHFADGRHNDGVALLAAFRPAHPLVAQALERMRTEAARLVEEGRAAADRAAQQAAEVAERIRREDDARIAREREQAATAAIKEAKRVRGPEAALAILRPALERDPDNVDLLRAVGANEAELQRAQLKAAEEASRQAEKAARDKADREKAESVKADRDKAAAAAAAAAAAQVVPGTIDADVDDRTILLKRDLPKPAPPSAPTPASAPLPGTPTLPVPKQAPAAPPTPPAAKSLPVAEPPAPKPRPAPAPVTGTPEPSQQSVAAKAPTPSSTVRDDAAARGVMSAADPAVSGGLSNAVKYGGAAAAVLLAVVGFVVFGGGSDAPTPVPDTATTVAPEEAAASPVSPAAQIQAAPPTPITTLPATPPPPGATPTTAMTAAPTPRGQQPPAASAQDRQLATLLADAQVQRQSGDSRAALETVESALKIRPRDGRFAELAGQIRQDVERRMTTARGVAQTVGQLATSHVTFREGDDLAVQARQHTDAGREIDAARTFMAAEVRFNTAALEGRRIAERQAASAAAAAAAAARPATPAAPTPPTPAQEEAAIRGVVERYRQAYNQLSADAVQAVFPAGPIAQLRTAFQGLESQSVTYNTVSVAIDASGTTATATVATSVVAKPRGRSEQSSRTPMTLSLRKDGTTWVITARK